jgi:hypothetical protein
VKARDIIAGILAEIPLASRPGRWFERVTDEQRGLVDIIGRAWVAGELGHSARAVAPSIAKRFQAAGVRVTPGTVREWLSELKRS